MKRVYESPVMMLEGFEANEYVAACSIVNCKGYYHDKAKAIDRHPLDCGYSEVVTDEELSKGKGTKTIQLNGIHYDNVITFNGHWNVSIDTLPAGYEHPNASM